MQKTKIVCTIGPSSDSPEIIEEMILSGMNVARMNFSHGSHEEHLKKVNILKSLRTKLHRPVALLLDTKGPEIRIKKFADHSVELIDNQLFTLTVRDVEGTSEIVGVTYRELPSTVKKGTRILLDDGLIELLVERIDHEDTICRVINGGIISNSKSINLPGLNTKMPYLNENDKDDLRFAYEQDFDFIALSFVRSAQDVLNVKSFLNGVGPSRCELIAKIENAEGVNNIDEIIRVSDGIMVARGDMGVEIPFEELPGIQKSLIKKCYSAGKKVITATQMLESMIRNPRPTRAEITDIANAIHDGTSAIMLSSETASGKYPIESLKTMIKIAEKTEASIDYTSRFYTYKYNHDQNITNAISHATCMTAHDLGAVAIVTVTLNGSTARRISRFRPGIKIVAVTPKLKTYMQLALSWGVIPLLSEFKESSAGLFKDAAKKTEEAGLVKEGSLIVITGSSPPNTNITNTLQVHMIGNVLARGTGHGTLSVCAKTCVIRSNEQPSGLVEGCIIVIDKTTNEVLRLLRGTRGVITEEDFSESGVAAAAIALDIPVITSVNDATKLIPDGSSVNMNPSQGFVYNGEMADPANKCVL